MKMFINPLPLSIIVFLFLTSKSSLLGQGNNCPKASSLEASQITETSATLSWDGSEEVEKYNVDVKHGTGTKPFSHSTTTTETSITVDGLLPGSTYRFRVMTKCDKGSGGSSQWKEFTTAGDKEDSDTGNGGSNGPCPKASNLAIEEITDSTATLTWLGNDENVSYKVDVQSKEHTTHYKYSEDTDTTVVMVEGLEPGGNYKFRVKASCEKNSAGSSSWINFSTTGGDSTYQQCPKPTNLSVLEVTDSSALLTWTAKDSVESFSLDVKSYEQTPSFRFNTTLEVDSFLVEGLSADGKYQFRVVATCTDGSTSGSSDWSKFRTLPAEEETEDESSTDDPQESDLTDSLNTVSANLTTFPNPASSEMHIKVPKEELGQVTNLILTDLSGRIVYETKIEGIPQQENIPIQVGELRSGVYKLMMVSDNFKKSSTIFINH